MSGSDRDEQRAAFARSAELRQLAAGDRTDIADAIVIIDTEFRIQSFNRAAEELYGWREAEVLGTRIEEVIPWLGGDADLDGFLRHLHDDGRWHGRAVHGRRDGGVVHVLASSALLEDGSGEISVNRVTTSDSPQTRETLDDLALREDIVRALGNDEFTVHYQPIVRLEDGTAIGVEALARWNHPTRGLLAPAEFIEAAERTGLIGQLDDIVLENACVQAQLWRDAGLDLFLAVNMSARQLSDENLPHKLADVMQRAQMRPGQLWLEITETSLVEDLDQARKALGQIDALGVKLSIDDFGTGWASLTYLREFPVHVLKIDRLFINGLGTASSDLAIVKSIVALGRELGLEVIAEGIETAEQVDVLVEVGCETGQGYLFGHPSPADELFGEDLTPAKIVSRPLPDNHGIHLYETDEEIVATVVDSFAAAIAAGDGILLVATAQHRHAIEAALGVRGVRPDPESYRTLDAETTLDALLVEPGAS